MTNVVSSVGTIGKSFLSTLSLRRATNWSGVPLVGRSHFYPRSPCGERRYPSGDCRLRAAYFYPRSPCGERPWCISRSTPVQADFYPRSPCGERQEHINRRTDNRNFYPRSPCGERQSSGWGIPNWESISIHALLAESDLPTASAWTLGGVFLSTLSLRRATRLIYRYGYGRGHFYPRSPCGERHQL